MLKCPNPFCQSENITPVKSWVIKPKKEYAEKHKISHAVQITINRCLNCGRKFRTTKKVEA